MIVSAVLLLPSIDKSIHGRIRANFAIDCVTFAPCTSLYTSFKCALSIDGIFRKNDRKKVDFLP